MTPVPVRLISIAVTVPPAGSAPQASFPPQDIASFLAFCAGEWLALRSCFELESGESPTSPASLAVPANSTANSMEPASDEAGEAEGEGDAWHSSERAELLVAYLEPAASGEAGGLRLRPPGGAAARELHFSHDGAFRSQAAPEPGGSEGRVAPAAAAAQPEGGHWQLWPDGSLELTVRGASVIVRERIWFTKPNLRLRSTVENRADGTPGRASFSSEIRRVSRPAASAEPAP